MTVRTLIAAKTLIAALVASTGISAAQAVSAEDVVLTALPAQRTAWIENYNPYNESSRLPSVVHFIYEPLVIFNAFNAGEPAFRLATDFAYSDDLSEIIVNLRDGVQWSDGESFTADDVVFSFDLVTGNTALDTFGIGETLASVEKLDDMTVKFVLASPSSQAFFQIVRVPIVAEHVWSAVEDPVTFLNTDPVGTGPLTQVERFTPQEYVQCRNPNYWDAESLHIDCMRFPQIANNDQALAAAAAGELDWMGSFLPDIENTYVSRDPDNHRYWLPGGSFVMFNMNLETDHEGNNAAFNDLSFRRAISMVMDRDAMVDIAGYGYPTINTYPSGLGRSFHSWNNPEADEAYGQYTEYNVDAALELLTEAGYSDANGDGFIDTPDGQPIEFDIIVPSGWTDWVNTVQIASEGLLALGINASISTPEAPIWSSRLIDGDYDFAINAISVGVTPYVHFERGLHSSNQGVTRFAAGRFRNDEITALLDAYTQTANEDEQREIIDQVQMIAAENMPFIPVFNNPLWYQFNTSRFTGFFDAENPAGNPVVHDNNPMRLLHLLALRSVD